MRGSIQRGEKDLRMDCEKVSSIRKHRLRSDLTTMGEDKENGVGEGMADERRRSYFSGVEIKSNDSWKEAADYPLLASEY